MKLSTVLKALLIVFPMAGTYVANAVATDTNSPPARTILLGSAAGVRILKQDEITAGLATACPDDLETAISCFQSKHIYANLAPIDALNERVERSNLVAVARFLGEIRSRRIPNYNGVAESENRLGYVTVSGTNVFNAQTSTDPEVKKAYEKSLADWQLHNKTFELQQELRMLDANLTPRLLDACSRLPKNDPANVELIKQVSDAAHLTEAERKKL